MDWVEFQQIAVVNSIIFRSFIQNQEGFGVIPNVRSSHASSRP